MRTEAQEQEAVIRWAAMSTGMYPELKLLFHIPNGGSRNRIEAAHLKKLGVKAGVPDLFLPVARGAYHGLFIEMKREKGGRVSEDQDAWLLALSSQGYATFVANGFEEARQMLEEYLAVDAVDVVRCEDCIHKNHCTWGEPGWYCADGKRKDDETERC